MRETAPGPPSPEHLRLTYIVAMVTGLRANELRSLTRAHLDTVLSGGIGAPVVHPTEVAVTPEAHKCLPEQALTASEIEWRRGDSNPRPEMLQDKHPTCLVAPFEISPCEAPNDQLNTQLFRCISLPSARTTDESQPTD